MKTWVDRLRAMPVERLKQLIKNDEQDIALRKRSLETMKRVLAEHTSNDSMQIAEDDLQFLETGL